MKVPTSKSQVDSWLAAHAADKPVDLATWKASTEAWSGWRLRFFQLLVHDSVGSEKVTLRTNFRAASELIDRHGGIRGDWAVPHEEGPFMTATLILNDGSVARLTLLKEGKMTRNTKAQAVALGTLSETETAAIAAIVGIEAASEFALWRQLGVEQYSAESRAAWLEGLDDKTFRAVTAVAPPTPRNKMIARLWEELGRMPSISEGDEEWRRMRHDALTALYAEGRIPTLADVEAVLTRCIGEPPSGGEFGWSLYHGGPAPEGKKWRLSSSGFSCATPMNTAYTFYGELAE